MTSTTVPLLNCYNKLWHQCINFLKRSHICLRTPPHQCPCEIQKAIREVTFNYKRITNLTCCWCISLELRKQTLVRTAKTSRVLFSSSLSLGLLATIACLSLAGKTHPEMLESPQMIIASTATQAASQGKCLFGWRESKKLMDGLLAQTRRHPSSEVSHQPCTVTCLWLVHKHTRTHTHPQEAQEECCLAASHHSLQT